MAISEWFSPGAIMGAVGIVMSGLSLIYTRRVDQRQQSAEQPTVNVMLERSGWDGWSSLIIVVSNGTQGIWELDRIDLPKGVRAATQTELSTPGKFGDEVPIQPTAENTRPGPIKLGYRIQQAGEASAYFGRADRVRAHLMISSPAAGKALRIRVRLRSLEAATRPITVTVYRSAPD